eukprot:SAG11_NODE_37186_length_258_cov_0.647799_1_plen_49_part_10
MLNMNPVHHPVLVCAGADDYLLGSDTDGRAEGKSTAGRKPLRARRFDA